MYDFNDEDINKYTGTRYDRDGFDKNGFDKDAINRHTDTKYDRDGFDQSGYNKEFNTREEVANPRVKTIHFENDSDKKTHRHTRLLKAKIGFFDKFKINEISDRADDEILYEYVLTEIEQDIKFKGLWAKAYANSEGNESKIEPLYMQYRVQSIKDRLVAMEIAYDQMNKKRLFDFIKDKLT